MPPKVESYGFGWIVINGKRYGSDVVILPDRVVEGWWRREGHRLGLEDLKEALESKPEVLVVGTGYYGVMKVPGETLEELKSRGIRVVVEPTEKAWKIYNEFAEKGVRVAAAFHLTC